MITAANVMAVVVDCTYKEGWSIRLHGDLNDGSMFLQIVVSKEVGRCSVSGKAVAWKGGKKYLSRFMCKQEIVGVVFAIIKAAEEHEMLEMFRYKGSSIFNPHLDPDVLAIVASKKASFVTRDNGTSMTLEEKENNHEST